MKKMIYFTFLMFAVIIILPLLIVKGCSVVKDEPSTPPQQQGEALVKVFIAQENKVKEMPFEEYIKGVVAAEMPAGFEIEALKAQAVAARTYALGRIKKIYTAKDDTHDGADICTAPGHCQAWVSKESVKKKWGIFSASKNWSKIDKAVNETKDVIITYDNIIINPLYHSNSGGKTENSEDAWNGVEVPYLKSVQSDGEEASAEFKSTITIKINSFYNKMKGQYPEIKLNKADILSGIKVLDYTAGERVKNISIGGVTLKGTDFRKLFSLKSANFKIEKYNKDTLKITTYGNGHGVGMSQWGANYLAKSGGSYEEILKYYYTGVQLKNSNDF